MLRDVVLMIDSISPAIHFAANTMTFVGGAYIALHNRVMPKWLITCLWYIGLASLLNAITFMVGWIYGEVHPLSHFQLGSVTEAMVNITIATTIAILFFNTVWKDFVFSKNRKKQEPVKQTSAKRVPASKKVVVKTTKPKSIGKKG